MQLKALLHTFYHAGILFKKPHVLLKAFLNLFYASVLGKDRLRVVEFVINSECDSKCRMCYATKYISPHEIPISTNEIASIWRESEKLGAMVAIVEGGEPTLHKDFDNIVRALNPSKNIVVVVSNSLGLTLKKLHHYKKMGISVMHLSLDGTTPEENDGVRGFDGHFERVLKAVEYCKKIGMSVYFSSVLSHSGKERFLRIVQLAERLNIGVSGALMITQGRSKDKKDRLTEEDRKWLHKLINRYYKIIRFDWNTNYSGNYACPAGREKISISLYGEVMACVCNHLSFGNTRVEPVRTIWDRTKHFSFFREKNPRCLVGFDTEYRRYFFDSLPEQDFLPVSIFSHPLHPKKKNKNGLIIE